MHQAARTYHKNETSWSYNVNETYGKLLMDNYRLLWPLWRSAVIWWCLSKHLWPVCQKDKLNVRRYSVSIEATWRLWKIELNFFFWKFGAQFLKITAPSTWNQWGIASDLLTTYTSTCLSDPSEHQNIWAFLEEIRLTYPV